MPQTRGDAFARVAWRSRLSPEPLTRHRETATRRVAFGASTERHSLCMHAHTYTLQRKPGARPAPRGPWLAARTRNDSGAMRDVQRLHRPRRGPRAARPFGHRHHARPAACVPTRRPAIADAQPRGHTTSTDTHERTSMRIGMHMSACGPTSRKAARRRAGRRSSSRAPSPQGRPGAAAPPATTAARCAAARDACGGRAPAMPQFRGGRIRRGAWG